MRNHKLTSVLVFAIVWLLLQACVVFAAEEQPAAQKTYDDYKVIYERNMFSRDRRPPQEDQPRRIERSQVLAIYVLRGIAAQKNERVAFIEEQVSGDTTKATVGSEVIGGKITKIHPDRVAFEQDGQTRYINIGGEFGKTETTVVSTVMETEGEQTSDLQGQTPTSQPVEDSGSSGDQNDILRKLMERRQSEIGQ